VVRQNGSEYARGARAEVPDDDPAHADTLAEQIELMGLRIVLRRGGHGPGGVARALLWLVGGGGLVVVTFFVSFFVAMRVEMRSSALAVPDLVGLTLEEARALAKTELVLEVVDQRNDPRVASGRILEQMPPEGASVRRGRKVKLVLSLGGRVLSVPDLVGQAARAVTIELAQEGFVPGEEARVHSARMEAGRVLAQVPPAQTSAVPSSRVHRLVSAGPLPVAAVMPDLRGRRREEVEQWIEMAGLRRGAVRHVAAAGRAQGLVVAQAPLSGHPVRVKDVVDLAVAE
jgi:serine/threonine-protein kinase